MVNAQTPSRSTRPASPPATSAPKRPRPRAPRPAGFAHHWIGPLYCLTPGCGTILGEIFADGAGQTYLAAIGTRPVRHTKIECPDCAKERTFDSQPGGPLSSLVESSYSQTNRDTGKA